MASLPSLRAWNPHIPVQIFGWFAVLFAAIVLVAAVLVLEPGRMFARYNAPSVLVYGTALLYGLLGFMGGLIIAVLVRRGAKHGD